MQLSAIPMEHLSRALLVVDAVLHTAPLRTQIVGQAEEVAPKCNGMDRMYCFAYDIVGMTMMNGIAPEIQLAQMNYCNEYDWPKFRRRSLHPDDHSYSVSRMNENKSKETLQILYYLDYSIWK